jgi:hypothetical protein
MRMIPVKSSNLKSAGFENNVMRVEFGNGTMYDYTQVSAEVFNDFLQAKSQGKFFNVNIRGKFSGSKVVKEEDDG